MWRNGRPIPAGRGRRDLLLDAADGSWGAAHCTPRLLIQAADRRRGQLTQHRTPLTRAELSGRQGAMGVQGELDSLRDVRRDGGRRHRLRRSCVRLPDCRRRLRQESPQTGSFLPAPLSRLAADLPDQGRRLPAGSRQPPAERSGDRELGNPPGVMVLDRIGDHMFAGRKASSGPSHGMSPSRIAPGGPAPSLRHGGRADELYHFRGSGCA